MTRTLSVDLRSRVVRAVEDGTSCRAAAARFGVSASSAVRWHAKWRAERSVAPKPRGGDRLSVRTEAHGAAIEEILAEEADITLVELKGRLAVDGAPVSISALWRFFRRHAITRKKRPATPRSRTGRTSSRAATPGSKPGRASIRSA